MCENDSTRDWKRLHDSFTHTCEQQRNSRSLEVDKHLCPEPFLYSEVILLSLTPLTDWN